MASTKKRNPEPARGDPFPTPTPLWLRRFILGFAGFYGILFIVFGGYSLYGRYGVVEPAREALEDGSPEALARALEILRDPHVFSGYAPYHGFGNDRSKELAETVDGVVARGEAYTDAQQTELIQWASYWIAAVETHKVHGDVPWSDGDKVVLQSLIDRWDNGIANTRMVMIYLALVALVFGSLYLVYRRKKLFDKIGPLPTD
ncbi:MAG: hypothetical protein ABIK09_19960 [Pseudomonadota bacterium]